MAKLIEITNNYPVEMGNLVGQEFTHKNKMYLVVPVGHPWYGVKHTEIQLDTAYHTTIELASSEELGVTFNIPGVAGWVIGVKRLGNVSAYMSQFAIVVRQAQRAA